MVLALSCYGGVERLLFGVWLIFVRCVLYWVCCVDSGDLLCGYVLHTCRLVCFRFGLLVLQFLGVCFDCCVLLLCFMVSCVGFWLHTY